MNLLPARSITLAVRAALFLAAVCLPWLRAADSAPKKFDIAAGEAGQALRQFAQQSGVELLYSPNEIAGAKTNSVQGELPLRTALEQLLAGSGLTATQSKTNGALAVMRASDPNAARAAHSSDRPSPDRGAAPLRNVAPNAAEQEPVALSPFEVRSEKDQGYVAASSLAGTRLNSELWETPAAISVMTKEFLEDTGVLNVNAALDYAMNIATDYSDYTGQTIAYNDINIQMRGFVGAQVGRNFFSSTLSGDRFNMERIDFSRGPNSVLFGLGSPGGIVNTSTKRARVNQRIDDLRVRFASFDDYRAELDFGRTVVPDKVAVRMNLVWQDRDGWREFERLTRKAGAFAATFRPTKTTELRLEAEYGDVDQVIALAFPAHEAYLGWINNGRIPATLGAPNPTTGLQTIGAAAGTGAVGQGTRLIWDPYSGNGPVAWVSGLKVSSSGSPTSPALSDLRASILDETIMPRRAAITGPGFTGDYHYYQYAAFLEQRVSEDLAFEAAFNRQQQTRFNDRAQGFGQVSLKIDPNTHRPVTSGVNAAGTAAEVKSWEPNPNFGKFYTESLSDHRLLVQDGRTDDYRLTGSYRLDFTKRSRWFGRHDLAALASRTNSYNWNDEFQMVNLTPAGNAVYPLNLTAGNNRIHRRTYLDFSQSDPRWHGMYDWKKFRLTGRPEQNGVTEGWVRVDDAGRDGLTRLDTTMGVVQSRWLEGRFTATAGLRRDRQRIWSDAGTATQAPAGDPRFGEYTRRSRTGTVNHSEGTTRSIGLVFQPLPWAAVFYNSSDSFRPQSAEDIFEQQIGNRKGIGHDYGIRLRLLDQRLHVTLNQWTVDDQNQAVGVSNNFINYINGIWTTLNRPGNIRLVTARDTQTLAGRGNELEVTANLTRHWRLSLNVAQTEQVLSGLLQRHRAYLEQHRAEFSASANTPLVEAVGTLQQGASIGQAIAAADAILTTAQISEGQTRRQLREYTGNLFTTYSLRAWNSWLRGVTIGGGAQYRGPGVIGYDTSRNNAAIRGGGYTLVNAMARYSRKLFGRTTTFQFNLDNALGEDEPIVTDADQFRAYRYVFQKPRTWSLQMTVAF